MLRLLKRFKKFLSIVLLFNIIVCGAERAPQQLLMVFAGEAQI